MAAPKNGSAGGDGRPDDNGAIEDSKRPRRRPSVLLPRPMDWLKRRFQRKRLRERFTNGESLRLFTQAVESFQSYQGDPDSKKLEAASEKLEFCRDRYPHDLLPLFYLGLVRVEQSYAGLQEALELFEKIRRSGDRDLQLDATFNLGIANLELYESESRTRARELLETARDLATQTGSSRNRAIELHAKMLLAYLEVSDLRWKLIAGRKGDLEAVDRKLQLLREELPEDDPGDIPKSYVRAEYWNAMGLAAECRAIASADDPEERRKRADEAEKHFKQALHHKRNWIPSLSNLAVLYQESYDDRSDEALELWKQILKIRPDDQYANLNLGNFYQDSDTDRAREHYAKAPNLKQAKEALEALPGEKGGLKGFVERFFD
jgi:hypothetical protein